MKELANLLAEEFNDKIYAHSYMEAHAVTRIAAQVYAIRKQRGLSQEELARLAGVAQERISKIENEDFDSLTMKTLQKLSRAFDVNLRVSFESFSKGIVDVVNINPQVLEVDSREADLEGFRNKILQRDGYGAWQSVESTIFQTGVAVVDVGDITDMTTVDVPKLMQGVM